MAPFCDFDVANTYMKVPGKKMRQRAFYEVEL